jgi:hypothetical protein
LLSYWFPLLPFFSPLTLLPTPTLIPFRPPIGSISVHVPGPENPESSQLGHFTQISENISPAFSRICPKSLSGMANRSPQGARMGSGERECRIDPGHLPECIVSHTGDFPGLRSGPQNSPSFHYDPPTPPTPLHFASGKRTLAYIFLPLNALFQL